MKPDKSMRRLRAFVKRHNTQKDAAAALGISPQYLGDLLTERRDFSDTVLQKLGLRAKRIVVNA